MQEERGMGGLILAGGRGERLGQDKAHFLVDGTPMLLRVLSNLAPCCDRRVVVAREDQLLPPLPADVTRTDDAIYNRGPLAGIAVGLSHLRAHVDRAIVVPTDMPFLCAPFVSALDRRLGNRDAACVLRGGRAQPLAAIFRTRLSEAAEELLRHVPHASPKMLLAQIDHATIEEDELWEDAELGRSDPTRRSLMDIDTIEDLAH
jgi:molybdenum cofactor guanylyltransferase